MSLLLNATLVLFCCEVRVLPPEHEYETWPAVAESEKLRTYQRLAADWELQSQAAVNSHMVLRYVNAPTRHISRDTLIALIKDKDPAASVDDLKEIVQGVLRKGPDGALPAELWGKLEFWEFGRRLRSECTFGDDHVIDAFTEETAVQYQRGSAQATIQDAVAARPLVLSSLHNFRFIPPQEPQQRTMAMRRDGDILFIDSRGSTQYYSQLVVHHESGEVLRVISFGPKKRIVGDRWQDGWSTSPGGVRYPRFYLDADYDNMGNLNKITLAAIEAAEFNLDIDPSRVTVVSVPAGTLVIDRRAGSEFRRRLKQDCADVLVGRPAMFAQTTTPAARRPWRNWWLISNVLIIATLVLYWTVRGRSTRNARE